MTTYCLDRPRPRLHSIQAPRLIWAAAGVPSLALAIALIGPWALPLWLLPDVGLLLGGRSAFTGDGRLSPRAVRGYNALHSLPGPIVLIAAGAVLSPAGLAAGVLWLSHVTLDRAMGYGLRAPDGSQRV